MDITQKFCKDKELIKKATKQAIVEACKKHFEKGKKYIIEIDDEMTTAIVSEVNANGEKEFYFSHELTDIEFTKVEEV